MKHQHDARLQYLILTPPSKRNAGWRCLYCGEESKSQRMLRADAVKAAENHNQTSTRGRYR